MSREEASASVLAAAVAGAVAILAVAIAASGQLLAAWSTASTAADAAALAAAPLTFQSSGGSPAKEAASFARANGARLVRCRCRVDGSYASRTVEVEVEVTTELPIVGELPVRVSSRAEFVPLAAFDD